MAEGIVGRGTNIKCYDKVKLTNLKTGHLLHACNFDWGSGSFSQAVTCHKAPDDSDWYCHLDSGSFQSVLFIPTLPTTSGTKIKCISATARPPSTYTFRPNLRVLSPRRWRSHCGSPIGK